MLGGMSIRNNWVDVITIVVVGILGFYMIQQNFSVIAMILGVILGPIAEENLARSLQISGGSFDIFITRPISLFLVIVLLMVLSGPLLSTISKKLNILR
jgi:putative tricarboxylic transport membrane protein